jgi:hypothetical protein
MFSFDPGKNSTMTLMNLSPPIHELPFILQREIMEFRPRLPSNMRIRFLARHFNNRYCSVCGEYIDMFRYKNRKLPFHIHPSSCKVRIRYKGPVKRVYSIVFPTLYNLLPPIHSHHTISNTQYMMQSQYDVELPVRLMCRIRGPRCFYNFKTFVNGRSRSFKLCRDPRSFNIFENPEIYVTNLDDIFTVPIKEDETLLLARCRDDRHIDHVAHILRHILNIFPGILRNLLEWIDFLQYPSILLMLVDKFPLSTMSRLSCRSYLDEKKMNHLLMIVLRYNYHLIQHLSERRIVRLFQSNRSFFFDLYEEHPDAKNYFYFEDSLEITRPVRLTLFSTKRKTRS